VRRILAAAGPTATDHAAAIRVPVLAGYAPADRILAAGQRRYLQRALARAHVVALGARRPALRPRQRPAAALRAWWGAVRAQLQRAARPRR
jgi:hypothetical protein